MATQLSIACRNAMLDAIETFAGTSAKLVIRDGAAPANCAAANAGNALATLNLPADYFSDAAAGVKALLGTWQDTSADATGTAAHWRLYKSDGTTCVAQGTVTATGMGGDLTLDSTSITATQVVTVTSFSLTAANA